MKKIILIALVAMIGVSANAQNPRYVAAMEKNTPVADTTRDGDKLQGLANNFERIAGAEKSEWLPLYYAAYCYAKMTYTVKGNTIDTYCDKADAFIKKADSL